MPSIKFFTNNPSTTTRSHSKPGPTIKELPEWYVSAERFATMPDGQPYVGPDGGKIPTWKACPAIYDVLGTGYVLKTPCDLDFFIDDNGIIDVKVKDARFANFVSRRDPMPQFDAPIGAYKHHFAWYSDWGIETPKGYSTLYLTPMNRFDLPFQNTTGIIDTDNVSLPGTLPFFIAEGWTGTLPAGTPYVQLLPFKREDWKSTTEEVSPTTMYNSNMTNSMKYRKPDGGVYQKEVWQRRKYE
jgi:hypothetical protein